MDPTWKWTLNPTQSSSRASSYTLLSLRTFNQLETNAKITQLHWDQYINVRVRDKWLTMASGYQLVEEEEIYPLEECAKGEELKRVNNLNKELATPAEGFWTRCKLTILFNDFALSQNKRVKMKNDHNFTLNKRDPFT